MIPRPLELETDILILERIFMPLGHFQIFQKNGANKFD